MQTTKEKQQKALVLEEKRYEQAIKDNNPSKAAIHEKNITNLKAKIGY